SVLISSGACIIPPLICSVCSLSLVVVYAAPLIYTSHNPVKKLLSGRLPGFIAIKHGTIVPEPPSLRIRYWRFIGSYASTTPSSFHTTVPSVYHTLSPMEISAAGTLPAGKGSG